MSASITSSLLAGAAEAARLPARASADEEAFLGALCAVLLVLGGVAGVLLHAVGVTAPYGRYSRGGWGPAVPARAAWALQESPVLLMVAACVARSPAPPSGVPAAVLAMLALHYTRRTVVYPLRIRGGKPTPLSVVLLAAAFCLANGYVQARWLTQFARYPPYYASGLRFQAGALLFAAGFAANAHSDAVLRGLRAPGETGYKIPRRGLFRLVSGAHFFGECVMWAGYALASWSFVGLVFFAFTVANLAPRAAQHHRWYLARFGASYPRGRKILVPFVW